MVIINETMARQFWKDRNPVGSRIWLGIDDQKVLRAIVGVVGDVRSARLSDLPRPETFVPHRQVAWRAMGLVVRTTTADPESVVPAIRERMAGIDPTLPLARVRTMADVVDAATGDTRLSSTLTAIFAIVAALLASLGVYSVISYSVAQRTRELGVRIALGADRRAVAGLVIKEALVLTAAGVAVGVLVSVLFTRALTSLLYQVSPTDPTILAGACAGVLLVAVFASYIPALPAMRVDPMAALRAE
jgi:putative ABC transport system permease protein